MKTKTTKRDEIALLKRRMKSLEGKMADRDIAYLALVRHCRKVADHALRLLREKESSWGVAR